MQDWVFRLGAVHEKWPSTILEEIKVRTKDGENLETYRKIVWTICKNHELKIHNYPTNIVRQIQNYPI